MCRSTSKTTNDAMHNKYIANGNDKDKDMAAVVAM